MSRPSTGMCPGCGSTGRGIWPRKNGFACRCGARFEQKLQPVKRGSNPAPCSYPMLLARQIMRMVP